MLHWLWTPVWEKKIDRRYFLILLRQYSNTSNGCTRPHPDCFRITATAEAKPKIIAILLKINPVDCLFFGRLLPRVITYVGREPLTWTSKGNTVCVGCLHRCIFVINNWMKNIATLARGKMNGWDLGEEWKRFKLSWVLLTEKSYTCKRSSPR